VFVDYLPLTTVREIDIEQLHTAADRWVNRQPLPPNVTDYYYGRMRFISDARQWLHFMGRLRQPAVPQRSYTPMIQAYADYMAQECGLIPAHYSQPLLGTGAVSRPLLATATPL
jgi:hypothetical protein